MQIHCAREVQRPSPYPKSQYSSPFITSTPILKSEIGPTSLGHIVKKKKIKVNLSHKVMLATELHHFKMRNMAQAGLGGGRKEGDISI